MTEVIKETLMCSFKILPFLFVTYLIMEYIEHRMGEKSKEVIRKSGKYGPILGSLLGIFPQCGFSVSATNLYAGRVITLGTLIAVYLSTSDEMLPIFISQSIPLSIIVKVLGIKVIIGIIAGIIIDLVINKFKKNRETKQIEEKNEIHHLCEEEHCHCNESGVFKSACKHTLNIFVFLIIICFVINTLVFLIGKDAIANLVLNKPILGPMLSSLIGLLPNCAASVIITNLYLENVISFGSMIAGLLTGAGVAIAVLFKANKGKLKENLGITFLVYSIGAISGIILEFMGIII